MTTTVDLLPAQVSAPARSQQPGPETAATAEFLFPDLRKWGRAREAERHDRVTLKGALYRPGDYVTFSAIANCAVTVQIIEPQHTGTIDYLYSDGRIGTTRTVLEHWRPATPAEIEHWRSNTPAHLSGRDDQDDFPTGLPESQRRAHRTLHAMRVSYEALLNAALANNTTDETDSPLTLRQAHEIAETTGYLVGAIAEVLSALRTATAADGEPVTIEVAEPTRRATLLLLGKFADLLTETDPDTGPHTDPRALR